ncbi:MAG: IspD/TarI family cytidylyltransferase [Victivallaceae bacterium]|nr:IspD/TarI family cytidylyltransferase [Victivallaceae bacterium]
MNNPAIIIVAAGSARRFGGGSKLLLELVGKPVFIHSLLALAPAARSGGLVVVVPAEEIDAFRAAAEKFACADGVIWAIGGAERSDSVRNGLAALRCDGNGVVAIPDAARPLVTLNLLDKLVKRALEVGGAVPGKPVTDTLKRTGGDGVIEATVSREALWSVETPQVFDLIRLREAYARISGIRTDDAGVMEAAGFPCAVVENPEPNLKITFRRDTEHIAELLAERET